jgi:hypothetical protein
MINDTKNYPLSWDRSTETRVDVVHLILSTLSVNSSGQRYWHLRIAREQAIIAWLTNQESTGKFSFERPMCHFVFERSEDAVLFALRWL